MKDFNNKLVTVKIRGYERFSGVFLSDGNEWILLRNISGDYIIDGFKLINKKHILSISLLQTEPLNTIIRLKHASFNYKHNYDLDNTINLIKNLNHDRILVLLLLNDENSAFVGYVNEIFMKSFSLNELTSKGLLSGLFINYKYKKVRIIEINSDYLVSLNMYYKQLPPLAQACPFR